MQLEIGYPAEDDELEILYSRQEKDPLEEIEPVIDCNIVCEIQNKVRQVKIEKSIGHYIVRIIRATRDNLNVKLGASPRAFLALTRCAQAKAFYYDRDYLIPDDVKQLASAVLSHRIILENKVKYAGADKKDIFKEILNKISVPV